MVFTHDRMRSSKWRSMEQAEAWCSRGRKIIDVPSAQRAKDDDGGALWQRTTHALKQATHADAPARFTQSAKAWTSANRYSIMAWPSLSSALSFCVAGRLGLCAASRLDEEGVTIGATASRNMKESSATHNASQPTKTKQLGVVSPKSQ